MQMPVDERTIDVNCDEQILGKFILASIVKIGTDRETEKIPKPLQRHNR